MTVETATYVSELNPLYPLSGDFVKYGDDHLRLIKAALKATLPSTAVDNTILRFNGVLGALQTSLVTIGDNDNLVAPGSISSTGADQNFNLGGNRAFMDFASSKGRIGSLRGGGSAVGLSIYADGAVIATTGSAGGSGFTQQIWGRLASMRLDIGDPTGGPGGNAYDGGILVQSVTGDYQVCAHHLSPTPGLVPEWGPITEFVSYRTYDQSTNFQRISFTSMGAYAGAALNDAADDYRIQMESAGTKNRIPLKIVTQGNQSGETGGNWLTEFMTFLPTGNVQVFRRTDYPGPTGDTLEFILSQDKATLGNVLTAAGQQDSPKLRWSGKSYDSSLHSVDFRTYVDVTSNAGAGNWLLDYRLDSGSWTTKIVVTSSGNLLPGANDGGALGATSNQWSDLFLAAGGVINWANGGITLTETSDVLVFDGAVSYKFGGTGALVTPSTNDGAALGTTSLAWSDLFLASGAIVNIANGDWIATHSSGILTVGTGDLRITTAGTNSTSAVTVGGSQSLTGKTYNGLTITTTTGTFTLTNGKVFSVLKTLSLDGTDSTTMTFPTTSATIARIDAANTFIGASTATSWIANTFDVRGVWTAGAAWTLPAYTLGGIVSGGGNQVNNVIIGTVTPLAGFFTTLTVSGSAVVANGMYLPTTNTPAISNNSLDVARFLPTASAVNYATIKGAATGGGGNRVTYGCEGSDTDISIDFTAKGAGTVNFNGRGSNAGGIARFSTFGAGASNGFSLTSAASGSGPNLSATDLGGTGNSNIDINIIPAGTGQVRLQTATLRIDQTPTAVSGAGPFLIGSASTLNARASLSCNGTTYWFPCSTTAF